MSSNWTAADMPSQEGRTALVTGANSGLGLRAATELAGAGATVLLGCRDGERAAAAAAGICERHAEAEVEPVELDLADLGSVERAADAVAARPEPLDLLVNNAGVMAPPRRETADGFDLQLGTNHLGHFTLTGRLLERLLTAPAPRVVTLSSLMHAVGRIDLDDLGWERRRYSRWRAYGDSKLANLLFTFELHRRAAAAGSGLLAVAAHPGYAATNLQSAGPGMGTLGPLLKPVMKVGNLLLAQDESRGALPTLYAATALDVGGGEYFGPDGVGQRRGHPKRVGCSPRARDEQLARRLWEESERLTGVGYDFVPARR